MYRIYVEKKKKFALEARALQREIQDYLGISGVTELRILDRYDVDYINDETFEKAKYEVFAEKNVDDLYGSEYSFDQSAYVIITQSIEGKYDQMADLTAQQLKLLEYHANPMVRIAKVILINGKLTDDQLKKIKSYVINPIDNVEVTNELPRSIDFKYENPEDIKILNGFAAFDEGQLLDFKTQYGIGMSKENLIFCQNYFREQHKDPTITEIKILDAYWSDHCRHSTFNTIIDNVEIEKDGFGDEIKKAYETYLAAKEQVYAGKGARETTLMDIAVMGMKKLRQEGKLDDMEQSDEVNACSIVVEVETDNGKEEWLVLFKNETHNHPTEIEPFGGASTCIGGGIRDPLSGRAYVYGAMRVTGSGDPRAAFEETLKGKLSQRQITRTAAEGYSSYANQIGLAAGYLTEIYDEGYVAKRMECGALVGAVKRSNVIREQPVKGDVVILLGGNTGRDGCGGATGSSKEHSEDSLLQGGAEVQKGNPIIERGIVRMFRDPKVTKLIKKCNDFGAGGVSVAVGEIADSLLINLDAVPVKYKGLDGTELAISESQERMAVLVAGEHADEFIKLANEENTQAVKIADVTDTGRIIMTWQGKEIVNISRDFINTGGVTAHIRVEVETATTKEPEMISKEVTLTKDVKHNWLKNLEDLNVCSKGSLASMFDATAGNTNVLFPFGGKYQKTLEEGLAMRLPLKDGRTDFGTLMSVGYNPKLSSWSPFHGAVYAVLESVTKIVAMGGDYSKIRLSFQEYFERLGENPKKWGKPFSALLGAYMAQEKLQIPSIGGKDSMSGTFENIDVPPALISFAIVPYNVKQTVSRAFKEVGSRVIFVYADMDENYMVNFDRYKNNMTQVHTLITNGQIKAAGTVGFGGIAAAISQMCFGNRIGFKMEDITQKDLFTPCYNGIILEVTDGADLSGLKYFNLGTTITDKHIEVEHEKIQLTQALQSWEKTLKPVFENNSTAKVLIPIFPGAIGEYELEKAFKNAGAEVTTYIFKNLTTEMIEESYKGLAEAIGEADCLTIPSGVNISKFISVVLKNSLVKESITQLLKEKDGLILGLGEGFKALVKTGLIPYGEIRDTDKCEINIVRNKANQYICKIVKLKAAAVNSPWTIGIEPGDIESAAVSSAEGAIHVTKEIYEELKSKGQIPFQYIDFDGHVTMDIQANPFSSAYGIESLTSEDGRVLGRMALSERMEEGLYINVETKKAFPIFQNAVNYLKSR